MLSQIAPCKTAPRKISLAMLPKSNINVDLRFIQPPTLIKETRYNARLNYGRTFTKQQKLLVL